MATGTLHLRRFLSLYAETVAGWVADDQELFWLAPSTEAPLTADKVLGWARKAGHPFLLCTGDDECPIGYAELNPLRRRRDHLWVGHVIVAPAWRGHGVGVLFMRMLLEHAYNDLRANQVSLVVFPNNHAAIQCYLRVGFTSREEQYHKFGRPAKSYRMLHLVSVGRVPPAEPRQEA
ncbi:MAG: GNAT family N-acetyltransferase [Phycisphaerae bacterium]|nr:GNAT family N-acetyltransferase [Phycisphaerae bacterium]